MQHNANAYTTKSFGLTILKAFFIFILIISFSQSAFCSQNHIEKKRKETHAKVLRFKRLETIETNKLYKNQQRLENAQKNLNIYASKKLISLPLISSPQVLESHNEVSQIPALPKPVQREHCCRVLPAENQGM